MENSYLSFGDTKDFLKICSKNEELLERHYTKMLSRITNTLICFSLLAQFHIYDCNFQI